MNFAEHSAKKITTLYRARLFGPKMGLENREYIETPDVNMVVNGLRKMPVFESSISGGIGYVQAVHIDSEGGIYICVVSEYEKFADVVEETFKKGAAYFTMAWKTGEITECVLPSKLSVFPSSIILTSDTHAEGAEPIEVFDDVPIEEIFVTKFSSDLVRLRQKYAQVQKDIEEEKKKITGYEELMAKMQSSKRKLFLAQEWRNSTIKRIRRLEKGNGEETSLTPDEIELERLEKEFSRQSAIHSSNATAARTWGSRSGDDYDDYRDYKQDRNDAKYEMERLALSIEQLKKKMATH